MKFESLSKYHAMTFYCECVKKQMHFFPEILSFYLPVKLPIKFAQNETHQEKVGKKRSNQALVSKQIVTNAQSDERNATPLPRSHFHSKLANLNVC